MRVDRGIPGGAGKIFTLAVLDVFSVSLDVPLGESEIEDEDLVGGLVEANAKVIGFDVSVDEVAVVDVLDAGDHLVDQHEDGLQGELPEGLVEERFQ